MPAFGRSLEPPAPGPAASVRERARRLLVRPASRVRNRLLQVRRRPLRPVDRIPPAAKPGLLPGCRGVARRRACGRHKGGEARAGCIVEHGPALVRRAVADHRLVGYPADWHAVRARCTRMLLSRRRL